jgi:hypothetical protein
MGISRKGYGVRLWNVFVGMVALALLLPASSQNVYADDPDPFKDMAIKMTQTVVVKALPTDEPAPAPQPMPPEQPPADVPPPEEPGEAIPPVSLEGFAVLPADTFAAGPPAGSAIEGDNFGRVAPFESQPVQGFSAVLPGPNGHYLGMSDNGFGAKGNSPDYLLRWYELAVNFDNGTVAVVGYTNLKDPQNHIAWPIVNEESRLLTGADFDLESFRQAPDGTFWFGDEFGPFLLHTDASGNLLEPPIPTPYPAALADYVRGLPFIQSPQNPAFFDLSDDDARTAAANLRGSRGFEGMAMNTSGTMLYPLMEGALFDDPVPNRLLIQEFDLARGAYTGNYWFYPMSSEKHAIGDMTAFSDNEFLVIERDSKQGHEAMFKRIYKVDLRQSSEDGTLAKTLVVDLMAITDSKGLTQPEDGAIGLGTNFTFPFVTIESVYPVDNQTLLVMNDNNYPFSSGRRPEIAPDDNEFILLGLPEPLF